MSENVTFCEKEAAVIEAMRRGAWEEDLRAHVAGCSACADAALAAQVLREMQAGAIAEARVPAAGWMWWRMQLRARREAAERVTQPITLIEQLTFACIALSAIGVAVWNWRAITAWFSSLAGASHLANVSIQGFFVSAWEKTGVLSLFCAGALILLCSVAAYFIWAEE